ncbi:WD40-repeat-containing domain protein [Endogone sp. FLAS-F59071]|nr:WD40-repeat-containing domain protein [Endogone sp. FLAS-F59071]|eukprot:RUS18648.1 WD40-repeat-containing domain protein [Endogone sp. FLAS-F59071]
MSSDEEDIDLNDDAGSQQDQDASDVDEIMETEETLVSSQVTPVMHTPTRTATQVQPQSTSSAIRKRVELQLQPGASICRSYDVAPYVAAIHTGHIYSLAATRCFRWVFTGSEDGYIRKWDFFASMNGKTMLTQVQRHQHVESVTKVRYSGFLLSYWDNEEQQDEKPKADPNNTEEERPPTPESKLSPVYSLDVHSEAVWGVTGLENGAINLVTIRHEEGRCHHVLQKHNGPVSVLRITPDEVGLISGSWDKNVVEWDLNTGSVVREYAGHNSQISSVAFQPKFVSPVGTPRERQVDGSINGNGKNDESTTTERKDKADSDIDMDQKEGMEMKEGVNEDDDHVMSDAKNATGAQDDGREKNIILTTSIDGNAFVWDRRVPNGVARKLLLPDRTPPWCLSACWSADGTKVYAGRRNGTVDEWDFTSQKHIRSFRMPANSGPVSYVTSMPNGKHIICASTDNIRMWNTSLDSSFTISSSDDGTTAKSSKASSVIPFSILPGHHGGIISQIRILLFLAHLRATWFWLVLHTRLESSEGGFFYESRFHFIDPTCRYMITTSGNRGWDGGSTNACLFYEITPILQTI